jgi:peptidoglycan/xylan/chitin deacetylase (PgdA/CDA1 family)
MAAMRSLYIAKVLGIICSVTTLGFFAYINIAPSSLRFSPIPQVTSVATNVSAISAISVPLRVPVEPTTQVKSAATTTLSGIQRQSVFPEGIISINFDDGWISSYTTGFPILKAAHMPATFYIISDYFENPVYITVPDMLAMQSAGEEIGDHTKSHPILTKLTNDQLEDEIAGSIRELKADGVQSITTFAYPYGAHNTTTDSIVKQTGYAAARTIDNGMDYPSSNPYLLQAREVMSNTSVTQVEQWIDIAIAHKEWLIIVFHQLNPTFLSHDPYSWPTANFKSIVYYLAAKHVTIMTNAAVINEYYKSN